MIKIEWYEEPAARDYCGEYTDIDEHSQEMHEAECPSGIISALISARNKAWAALIAEIFTQATDMNENLN